MDAIPGLPEVFGRGPFNYSVVDEVVVPKDIAPGLYVLSWRWDAEQTKQVWAQCSDVLIVPSVGSASQTQLRGRSMSARTGAVPSPVLPSGQKHLCTGDSLGLDVNDCDTWVEIYDNLGGPGWPASWSDQCSIRTDPCGCNHGWGKFVRCTAKRDYMRITEIYLKGKALVGNIPDSIGNMTALVALSFVETGITGTLPSSLGHLRHLGMVWFDHNVHLGGPIPESFTNLKSLSAFELHMSNFSGPLPELDWVNIADCTLNGLVFDCPLPMGAETCGCICK